MLDEQDRKWAGDITYIRTLEGWLYLCIVQDLFSRRIVGWSMSDRIDSALVSSAFRMALQQRRPMPGLLFHSDRGCAVCCRCVSGFVAQDKKALCSMSRKGDCWDNACSESFFSKLKGEHIQDRVMQPGMKLVRKCSGTLRCFTTEAGVMQL